MTWNDDVVLDLEMEFLHNGLPSIPRRSEWQPEPQPEPQRPLPLCPRRANTFHHVGTFPGFRPGSGQGRTAPGPPCSG